MRARTSSRQRAASIAAVLILMACELTACGGSSHASASSRSASAASAASAPTTASTRATATTPTTTASTPTASTAPSASPPTTPTPPVSSSVRGSAAFKHEHAELVDLVACAREHGVDVPEPNAHNKILPRGIDTHNAHFKEVSEICLSKIGEQERAEASKGP